MNAQEKIIVEQKGYFTVEQVDELCNYIVELVKSDKRFKAENGKDGAPGMHGKDGASAFRGIDYWTKADRDSIVSEVLKLIPKAKDGKDGVSPDPEEIMQKIKKEPFDINKILNNPQLRMLLRGGGVSSSTVNTFTKAQRGAKVTLTSSAGSCIWNMNDSNNYEITLTENTTFETPTDYSYGQSGVITVIQGGGGGFTINFDTNFWKFPGGTIPTATAAAGSIDKLIYYTDDTYGTMTILNDIL